MTDGLTYNLTATVIDAANNESAASATFSFKVDTDIGAAPTDVLLSNTTVAENSIDGFEIGTLSTDDTDLGDNFTFSLLDNGNGHFRIEGDKLVVNGPLDFEQTGSPLEIRVLVTDSDFQTAEHTYQIAVTDVDGKSISGSVKNDKIDATAKLKFRPTGEEDTISGKAGNDKISSLGGNDIIKGGAGNDRISGGDGTTSSGAAPATTRSPTASVPIR